MIEVTGHFDGRVVVPDEPSELKEGQRVTIRFEPDESPSKQYMTAGELACSEIVGIWADRTDIGDSTEYVNEMRRRIDRREI